MKLAKRMIFGKHSKISYSQTGEDLIADSVFTAIRIPRPSYLDIGAHDPVYLSNTYFFYRKGCRGVCVEPNPVYLEKIKKARSGDICLNAGIGTNRAARAPFYVLSEATLSTFSKEEADRYISYGRIHLVKTLDLPLMAIGDVTEKYFSAHPNFVSIDIEGPEMDVLNTIDFERNRSEVFCVETITYTEDKTERKREDIIEFMKKNGYFVYADTYTNTVFVDREKWRSRPI